MQINEQLDKAETKLVQSKDKYIKSNDLYEDDLLSGVYLVENSVIHLRNLANSCFRKTNPLLYEEMIDNISNSQYHITMSEKGGITKITLPCLLPHYKENKKNIITEPLNHFFRARQKKGQKFIYYSSAIIAIINHIKKDNPSVSIRDNDNYEYKQLINTLAFWFLPDDDYKDCYMFTSSVFSKNNYTAAYIIPIDKFSNWYNAFISRIKKQ